MSSKLSIAEVLVDLEAQIDELETQLPRPDGLAFACETLELPHLPYRFFQPAE